MQLDTKPLIDAIDRLIAKANSDLENSLESEGYVAAKDAVIYINSIEDGITALLNDNTDNLLESLKNEKNVSEFISGTWQQIKE